VLLGLNKVQNDAEKSSRSGSVPHIGFLLNHFLINEHSGIKGSKFMNLGNSLTVGGFLLKSKGNPTRFSVK